VPNAERAANNKKQYTVENRSKPKLLASTSSPSMKKAENLWL